MLGIHADDHPLTVERYCAYVHARHAEQTEVLFGELKDGKARFPVIFTHTRVCADGLERLVVLRGDVLLASNVRPLRYVGSIE